MPNPSMRDARAAADDTDADGNRTTGRRTVAPPTRSAFDPDPEPVKAGPVSRPAPPPTSADANTPVTGPGVSVIKAANTLANRGRVIDQAVIDAGG